MNYANIIPASAVDFKGWSTVIQLSGCSHFCESCFNQKAQRYNYGSEFTEEVYQELVAYACKPFIANIVIQGGDGLFHKNVNDCITLCRRLARELPTKCIVLFTGYTLVEIQQDLLRSPILETIDYLMDGKYRKDLPTKKPFRGSNNQVLHKLIGGISVEQN